MGDGAIVGIVVGVIVAAIGLMVLLNKLLDFLSSKFPVSYLIFLLLLIGGTYGSSFVEASATRTPLYIALSFVMFYCMFVGAESEHYTTTEADVYEGWDGDIHATVKDVDHYRPAWWIKLLTVAVCTAVASVLTLVLSVAWIPLILEAGFILWLLISIIRIRLRRR